MEFPVSVEPTAYTVNMAAAMMTAVTAIGSGDNAPLRRPPPMNASRLGANASSDASIAAPTAAVCSGLAGMTTSIGPSGPSTCGTMSAILGRLASPPTSTTAHVERVAR